MLNFADVHYKQMFIFHLHFYIDAVTPPSMECSTAVEMWFPHDMAMTYIDTMVGLLNKIGPTSFNFADVCYKPMFIFHSRFYKDIVTPPSMEYSTGVEMWYPHDTTS